MKEFREITILEAIETQDFSHDEMKNLKFIEKAAVEELQKENARLKEYETIVFNYVQGKSTTQAKHLGKHLAQALVDDHKEMKSRTKTMESTLDEIQKMLRFETKEVKKYKGLLETAYKELAKLPSFVKRVYKVEVPKQPNT